MDLEQRLDGRTTLVTGADGFVGSHLVDELLSHGCEVHALTRATSSCGLRNIDHNLDEITLHRGDLRDKKSIRTALSALEGSGDIIIFHLGAQSNVGESWERPFETVETNVIATLNLLQSCIDLDLDVSAFDMAGTSEEYGDVDGKAGAVELDEDSPTRPKSIYATSKLAADFLTKNYFDAYGFPGVTTRMFNAFGPRQTPRCITGTVITQALCRDSVELGALHPKRDMLYVEDGILAHIHVALDGEPGSRYVFGYGDTTSIREWVDRILDVGEQEGYWEEVGIESDDDRLRPGKSDVQALLADNSTMNDLSGWEPRVGWDEGIRRTIDWYAENKDRWWTRVDWR